MGRYVIAIDQGTTGSTVLVVSDSGEIVGRASREFPQHFPRPGWVEHELAEIWASVTEALGAALSESGVAAGECAAIGITNQRETTVLWERDSGRPVHRAIVWQDRRTADTCTQLQRAGLEGLFRERTGLVLDPYFSGTKLKWLLDHAGGGTLRARGGELAFGTIDSWLVYKLTGGRVHITDATNASRTLLYDIHRGQWDAELAGHLGVPLEMLPEVRSCAEVYGQTVAVPGLPDGIPIAGIAGDQQAALFGQTCFELGDAKCTYGTGAFLLMNTGREAVRSEHGLVTTVAWRIGEQTEYALEGSAFIAGAAVQWLRDQLGIIRSSEEVEALARQVDSSEGVVFVPALAGLGAPHWDPDARGLIAGLTRGSSAAHIARATLEGIAFQIADLAQAMEADAGRQMRRLRVDGGAAMNSLLMQFQADLLDVPVDRPRCVETTGLGAAYLAGLAVGVFEDRRAIADVYEVDETFQPAMDAPSRQQHLSRWRDAVGRAKTKA